jgi:hypothetical protein
LWQARWRGVAVGIAGGAVSLDLVDAIERHVEPIAALVLDHRDFDRALTDEDRLQPAVDADALLEVDDEVTRLERGDRLERRTGRVAPRAPEAALSSEDLVVGEDAKPRLSGIGSRESGIDLGDRGELRNRRPARR